VSRPRCGRLGSGAGIPCLRVAGRVRLRPPVAACRRGWPAASSAADRARVPVDRRPRELPPARIGQGPTPAAPRNGRHSAVGCDGGDRGAPVRNPELHRLREGADAAARPTSWPCASGRNHRCGDRARRAPAGGGGEECGGDHDLDHLPAPVCGDHHRQHRSCRLPQPGAGAGEGSQLAAGLVLLHVEADLHLAATPVGAELPCLGAPAQLAAAMGGGRNRGCSWGASSGIRRSLRVSSSQRPPPRRAISVAFPPPSRAGAPRTG